MRLTVIALLGVILAACGKGGGSTDAGGGIVLAGSCTYYHQADQSDLACQQYQVHAENVDHFQATQSSLCPAQGGTWSTGHCPDSPCYGCCNITAADGEVSSTCYMGSAYSGINASSCSGGFWTAAPI